MKSKIVSRVMLFLLITNMSILTFDVHKAKAEPKTWTVDDDEPADFLKIQDAIDAASPGDRIQVGSGTYYEKLLINKAISLVGERSTTTIIDAMQKGNPITVVVSKVTIQGFTIRNGSSYSGIFLYLNNNTSITNNIIKGNLYGIEIYMASNNYLARNNVENNQRGIWIFFSSNNTLRDNAIAQNTYNFGVWGLDLEYFLNDVDSSNTVDSKPVYYWINRHGGSVPLDAGYVALVNSTNLTVKNLTLNKNFYGILLAYTNNTIIQNNEITNNKDGIKLYESSYNNLIGNTIEDNERFGFWLGHSSNNKFYHNNLINNTNQVYEASWTAPGIPPSISVWDDGYPSAGNYWSNYSGIDADRDGIGDTSYIIDENNQDRYPLINPWSSGENGNGSDEDDSSENGEGDDETTHPFWAQWWFFAVVAVGTVALVGAVYFLQKKKTPTPTAPTLPSEDTACIMHG